MRKALIGLILVVPIFATAQNIIFNPGFDMTPWDTGWVRDSLIDTSSSGSATITLSYEIDSSNLYVSSPRSCNLRTYVQCVGGGGGVYGEASAVVEATMTQMFAPISNCVFKASLVDSCWKGRKYFYFMDFCINGVWKQFTFGAIETWTEVCTTITESDTISGIKFMSRSSGGGAGAAGWVSLQRQGVWIDDVSITKTSIEEARYKKQEASLEVYPNPFKTATSIQWPVGNEDKEIQIYNVTGKLVEEKKGNVIGKNLRAGVYFIKAKGYKLTKVIKLGGIK